jgi:N6-adenosine-specific RNA methylase IME4
VKLTKGSGNLDLFEQNENGITGKLQFGQGFYTRYQTELCLLGIRGDPPERKDKGVREIIQAAIREHSRKPDEIYERIGRLFDGPYLELFASQQSAHPKGWTRYSGKDRLPERRWASNSYPGEEGATK